MALNVDHSKAFRTPLQLRSLVEAVKNAGEHDENDWIEWKSQYNLSEKQTKATLARHILAMANRSVEKSSQVANGHGYILVGVEPGAVSGVSTIDLADLESGIRPYLGPQGPEWIPTYVKVDERQVLVIAVDPPRDGDPIYTLHKDYDKYYAGMIFVRRTAQTVIAGPGEVLRLTQRAQSSEERQSLTVETVNNPVVVPCWPWLEETLESLLGEERGIVEAGNKRRGGSRGPFTVAPNFDNRSESDYAREAEDYLSHYKTYLFDVAMQSYVRKGHGLLQLRLRNTQERSYQQVRVELELPDGVSAILGEDYSGDDVEAPSRPKPLGEDYSLIQSNIVNMRNIVPIGHTPDVHLRVEGRAILCDVASLRAEEILSLPAVHLVAFEKSRESSLVIPWSVTAVNALGRTRGHVEIELGAEIEKYTKEAEQADG
ncbi:AlbA family DNA-binding domain-containing protein [Streptomyces longwoodensis]|uniref:AlbA family DNA-binding domain-containing protein n=1 Tax=Streptomyces longwoodensis TaxID=68231 RepID=UPI0037FA7EF1